MKKYYLGIRACRNEKYFAFLLPVPAHLNVYAVLKDIPDIISANIYSTKPAAVAAVKAWNDGFQINGTFLYD